jgi:hypothetical protein
MNKLIHILKIIVLLSLLLSIAYASITSLSNTYVKQVIDTREVCKQLLLDTSSNNDIALFKKCKDKYL